MRILIGQAYQEGSSFCPLVSTRADFERLGLFFGEELSLIHISEPTRPY